MLRNPANLIILALFAAAILVSGYKTADATHRPDWNGRITPAGQMLAARSGHSATLLQDGRVLLAGGMVKNGQFLRTAEIYDPGKGTFVATGDMTAPLVGRASVLLLDGRVLLAGGWLPNGPANLAELYDPQAGKFIALGPMTVARARPTATLLNDGRVLIIGGGSGDREGLRSAEIFDPATKRFTLTGEMRVGRIAHTADRLADGRVLVAGGMDQGQVTASAELYDPSTEKFTSAGSMKHARYKHTSGVLSDGRVLIAGGSSDRDGAETFATVEIYDPKSNKFADAPNMANPRYKLPEHAAALKNGDLLIAGGDPNSERFDAQKNIFLKVTGGTDHPQWYLSETPLPNGDVLLAGGYSSSHEATNQVWLFHHN
jgi:hypothetical protein